MLDPSPELPDHTLVANVKLPARIWNVAAEGIVTLRDVRETSDEMFLSFQDLGAGSVTYLRKLLDRRRVDLVHCPLHKRGSPRHHAHERIGLLRAGCDDVDVDDDRPGLPLPRRQNRCGNRTQPGLLDHKAGDLWQRFGCLGDARLACFGGRRNNNAHQCRESQNCNVHRRSLIQRGIDHNI